MVVDQQRAHLGFMNNSANMTVNQIGQQLLFPLNLFYSPVEMELISGYNFH
jgi:hypothetical protein